MNLFENMARKHPTIVQKMCSAAIFAGKHIMDVYYKDDLGVKIKADDRLVSKGVSAVQYTGCV